MKHSLTKAGTKRLLYQGCSIVQIGITRIKARILTSNKIVS